MSDDEPGKPRNRWKLRLAVGLVVVLVSLWVVALTQLAHYLTSLIG